jgi:hypothetical protein
VGQGGENKLKTEFMKREQKIFQMSKRKSLASRLNPAHTAVTQKNRKTPANREKNKNISRK